MSLLSVFSAATVSAQQQAVGDTFDPFFRYTESEHKSFFQDLPGETVDPFTGTLRIVREDLSLPGRAGLDLHVVRTYSSKIWGRADLLDMEPLLAEKEHSVLGYGWSFHMGRLKNPNASGQSGMCSGDFPVYEAPDGTARVFYPKTSSNTVFVSKDFWRMERNCGALSGAGTCIWSDTGIRYEFSSAYNNQYFVGTMPVWPLSGVVDAFGNRIAVAYVSQTGAVEGITDTYGRSITFTYAADVDGLRLQTMNVNGKLFQYDYTTYTSEQTGGGLGRMPLPGARRFLTEVRPPTGPSEWYTYAYDADAAQNQYALNSITYPGGGVVGYGYDSADFFTGRETVPFSVVTERTVVDSRAGVSGTWTYSYVSPGPGTDFHVTSILRPDGKYDRYWIVGFGFVAGMSTGTERYTYGVGLTLEVERADGAEIEAYQWDGSQVPSISPAVYSAPVYSDNCGVYYVWDEHVSVPVMTVRQVLRDGALFTTTYSNFDQYGQPGMAVEAGQQAGFRNNGAPPPPTSRVTTTAYLSVENDLDGTTLNLLRGRPSAQSVCEGSDCYSSSWAHDPQRHYARTGETVSGVTTTFGYDAFGNIGSVTNALGQVLTLSDYSYGTPASIGYNDAFNVARTVSWEGWIESETNGRGHTTGYTYDDLGRTETVTPPGNANVTGYSYAPDGSWARIARGDYFKNTFFDGFGRVTSTADAVGVLTSARYDSMGRPWFKSYVYDASVGEVGEMLELDGLNRVVRVTKGYRPASASCDVAGACVVMTTYTGNCVELVEDRAANDSRTTWRCNSSFGDPDEQRLTQVYDANASLWQYAYRASGKLAGITAPAAGGNRAFGYDPSQFLTSEVAGDTGGLTYGRNAIGQMTSRLDARAVTVSYGYGDPLGRLRTISYQGGSPDDVSQDFDNANNLTHIESLNGGTFDYTHDELNRVTSEKWTYGGRSYWTTYRYDPAGCLYSVEYPSGASLAMTCDAANRVTSVSVGSAQIVGGITYHPSGMVSGMAFGNGRATTLSFDDRARVERVTSPGVTGLIYKYDGVDNVTSYENSAVLNSLRTMTYDKLDRLITSIAPYEWGTAIYDYDDLGNRKVSSVGSYTTNYSYDQSNRLFSASGSQSFKSMTLTWDPAGRLASSSDGATYRYDGRGRRVAKTDGGQTTLYHYDAAGRVIAESLGDGTKLRDYFYLGDKLVAVDGCLSGAPPACTERQWYHTDILGSVIARTDTTGAVVAQLDYQPWGEMFNAPPASAQGDRQYNGRVYDPGTGFHDYGARLYWPELGRFISADSVMGSLAAPASLNRFSYVLNNPYRYIDPTGGWAESVHFTATRQWAAEAGMTALQASRLAHWDNHTDFVGSGTGWIPGLGDQGAHFNTNTGGGDSREDRFAQGFARAVFLGRFAARASRSDDPALRALAASFEEDAMHALGNALHAYQDIEAHTPEVTDDNGGLFKSHAQGAGVDDENIHRAAAERTHAKTVKAVKDYQDAVKAQ